MTKFEFIQEAALRILSACPEYPSGSIGDKAAELADEVWTHEEKPEPAQEHEPEILKCYAHHYQTGETIPMDLVEKINNALKFNQGFVTGELCAASILDMKWHELTLDELNAIQGADAVRAFEEKVCKEMGLIDEIIPRYRTTYFNHIFNSGYSAGYYSYLWAEVLDMDAFEKFEAEGLFNPELASSFRKTFLERGGSEEPMTLFRSWRGADPDPAALLRGRGLE